MVDGGIGDYVEDVMRINPPVDPLFRVGEIGLGYDKDRDRVVVFRYALSRGNPDLANAFAAAVAAPNVKAALEAAAKKLTKGDAVVLHVLTYSPQLSKPIMKVVQFTIQ